MEMNSKKLKKTMAVAQSKKTPTRQATIPRKKIQRKEGTKEKVETKKRFHYNNILIEPRK